MKLDYIREFLVLAECRNYTLAAQKLYITQPALSRHIAALEKDLGTRLFTRSPHYVELTTDGVRAKETFQTIITNYEHLYHTIQSGQKGISGNLKIGMLYYAVNRDFGNLLPDFREQYPGVKLDYYSGQPHQIYQKLLNNEIDIGAIPLADYDGSEHMIFYKIASHPAVAMISCNHPLADRGSLTLEDIKSESIVLLEEDTCCTQSIKEALQRCGFTPEKTIMSSHIDTVPFTLMETGGIHINGSSFEIPGYQDMIRSIPINEPNLYFSVALAYRMDNYNPILPCILHIIEQNNKKDVPSTI